MQKMKIYIFFLFSILANTIIAQTNNQFKEVDRLMDSLLLPKNSFKAPLFLDQLSPFLNDPATRVYTAGKLNTVKRNEVDDLFGNTIKRVGETSDYKVETEFINKLNLTERPYTKYLILTAAIYKYSSDTVLETTEYRKALFKKYISVSPLEGFSNLLALSFKDTLSEIRFNKVWNTSEIEEMINYIRLYPKYYVSYFNLLNKHIYNNDLDSMPLTARLKAETDHLSKLLFSKSIGKNKGQTITLPELFRGEAYLLTLDDSVKNKLIDPLTMEKINKGELFISDSTFKIVSFLFNDKNNFTEQLVKKYNYYQRQIIEVINKYYISDSLAIENDITELQLDSFATGYPGIYSKRLSFDFLYQYISKKLNAKLTDEQLCKKIVTNAFEYYTLCSYNVLILNEENRIKFNSDSLVSSTRLINQYQLSNNKFCKQSNGEITGPNSDNRDLGSYYSSDQIGYINVVSRTYDLNRYKVREECTVVLKNGKRFQQVFVGDIPLKLRNLLQLNCTILDGIYYSFLERYLRVNYSINKPFNEFLDIVLSNPFVSIGVFNNSFASPMYPIDFSITEIKNTINSGTPDHIHLAIGTKLNYQKPVSAKIINLRSYLINNNAIPAEMKVSLKDFFKMIPDNNFKTPKVYFTNNSGAAKLNAMMNELYGLTIKYNTEIKLYTHLRGKAQALPMKKFCKWYQFLWCNNKGNKQKNIERQKIVKFAQNGLTNNETLLADLKLFDLTNIAEVVSITPIFYCYDRTSKSFISINYTTESNGSHHLVTAYSQALNYDIYSINSIFETADNQYINRYGVDLSNLTNHGYGYTAKLTELFISENMSDNSVSTRLSKNGFINLPDAAISPLDSASSKMIKNTELLMNMELESNLISDALNFTEIYKSGSGIPLDYTKNKIQENKDSLNNYIAQVVLAEGNKINSQFIEVQKKWEKGGEFNADNFISTVKFNITPYDKSLAVPVVGNFPAIPLPSIK